MSDCQPQLLFLMPDPKLTGAVNVQSVTSQAGPCTPTVVADVSTCGTLVPMLSLGNASSISAAAVGNCRKNSLINIC